MRTITPADIPEMIALKDSLEFFGGELNVFLGSSLGSSVSSELCVLGFSEAFTGFIGVMMGLV